MNTGLLICFFILSSHALLCISTFIPEGGSPILLQGEQLNSGSKEMMGRKEEDEKKEVKHVRRTKGGKGAGAGAGAGAHGGRGSNSNQHPQNRKKNHASSTLAESSLTVLQVNIGFVLAFLFFF